jgi:hypothetical protein
MMLRGRRSFAAFPLSLVVGVVACGGSEPAPVPPPPPPPPTAEAPPATPPPTPEPPPEKPTLPEVAFGPATPSDAPKKAPKVAIKTPTPEQSVAPDKAKDFEVKIDVKDWPTELGGPHVHLILDNKPYKPIYDPKVATKLSELMPGGDAIAEGEHLLIAFPSRMNHESVKAPGALAMVHFWVGKKGKSDWKAKDPMLIYSRPKGAYNASKADHVLVDWYLANVELGDAKYSIKANVNGPGVEGDGRSLKITEWKPYALDNLRNGDYKISLELDDKDGKAVPGAWNSTTRTITINRDAPEDPPMMPPAAASDKDKKPKDDKASKDKPAADKPAADKPKDDKAAADKPKDKPKDDKAAADKPKDDKKPKGDEKK